VDVEGFEPVVVRSANKLLGDKEVKNIVLEYNAGASGVAIRFIMFAVEHRQQMGKRE
jgi:hypothetical protein